MTTNPLWRSQAEIDQPYSRHASFTFTTTLDTAQNALSLTSRMAECHKVSFIVDLNDLYIEFDGNATTSTMLIPAGTGYFDDKVFFSSRISVINAVAGLNGRIRGIAWGR